jgi:hypothetical protein
MSLKYFETQVQMNAKQLWLHDTLALTVVVGQGRQKIILKIDAKILGKLFFQKINFLYGENKNVPKKFYFKPLPKLTF